MNKATFDPAVNIDLYFRKGRNGEKEFIFSDADGNDYPLTDTFEIRADFEIELTVEDNKIILSVDEEEVDSVRSSYFYEIVNTTTGKTWICGNAYFTETQSEEVTDFTEVTIVLNGEPVEVTLNAGTADPVEHFKGNWDASSNTFPGDETTIAGDFWRFTVGGTLDGGVWPAKTIAFALIDEPGQDPDNWRLL
jgi:hypothetical protein